jgi:hypothetical protein
VLEVAAGELRDPVAFVVPMKPADRPAHVTFRHSAG